MATPGWWVGRPRPGPRGWPWCSTRWRRPPRSPWCFLGLVCRLPTSRSKDRFHFNLRPKLRTKWILQWLTAVNIGPVVPVIGHFFAYMGCKNGTKLKWWNRLWLTRHSHFHQHFHIPENMIQDCNHRHDLLEDLLGILDGLHAFYPVKPNSFLFVLEQGSMTWQCQYLTIQYLLTLKAMMAIWQLTLSDIGL